MNIKRNIQIKTSVKSQLADLFTPIGIYLRLRDQFRDTILLESAGNQNNDKNYSFICINAIAGIEIRNYNEAELKFPLENPFKVQLTKFQLRKAKFRNWNTSARTFWIYEL